MDSQALINKTMRFVGQLLGVPVRLATRFLFAPRPVSQASICAMQHKDEVLVSCGGGGIFMFWMLGAAQAVVERRKKRTTKWAGSSAGALCAALTLCGVDRNFAVKLAHTLAVEYGLYSRPTGVVGVWGEIVRKWLDQLLPADAAARCSGGALTVQVTVWRGWWRGLSVDRVSDYRDREALIDTLMASCHVPFLMNGQLFTTLHLRDERQSALVCDGSAGWAIPGRRLFGIRAADLEIKGPHGRQPDYVVTQTDDTSFATNGDGPDFAELLSYESAMAMVQRGLVFTRRRLSIDDRI